MNFFFCLLLLHRSYWQEVLVSSWPLLETSLLTHTATHTKEHTTWYNLDISSPSLQVHSQDFPPHHRLCTHKHYRTHFEQHTLQENSEVAQSEETCPRSWRFISCCLFTPVCFTWLASEKYITVTLTHVVCMPNLPVNSALSKQGFLRGASSLITAPKRWTGRHVAKLYERPGIWLLMAQSVKTLQYLR